MKELKQHYIIKAPIDKVWQSLVNPKHIDKWGGGPAVMDDQVGTKFSLWDGDIHGTNIEVVKNKKLVQEWYGGKWDKPSIATFKLTKIKNGTQLIFSQKNVPDDAFKNINEGWKDYYLGSLKEYCEKNIKYKL